MYLFLEAFLLHIYYSEFYNRSFTVRDLCSYTVLPLLQINLKNRFIGQEKKSSINAKCRGR